MQREGLALRKKLFGNEHPDVARSLNNLAEVISAQGRPAEAESLFREALAMKQKLLGNEHPDVPNSLAGLSGALARSAHRALCDGLALVDCARGRGA